MNPSVDHRVILMTALEADVKVLAQIVKLSGLESVRCATVQELCGRIHEGAALAITTENMVNQQFRRMLSSELATQPEWSDFPLIILAAKNQSAEEGWTLLTEPPSSSHVLILERPTNTTTLVSSIRAAFNSRLRQYELRDQLAARRRTVLALRESEKRLLQFNDNLDKVVAERTAQLSRQASQLQLLASQLTELEQEQRRRFAGRLHDGLQQLILAAKMQLTIFSTSGKAEALHQAERLLDEALGATRTLTYELSPPALHDAETSSALGWLAGWFRKNYQFEVDFEIDDGFPTLPETLQVFLFVSLRELLLNSRKHSGVLRASVHLSRHDDHFARVEVSDEGKGFEPKEVEDFTELKGFGLFTIRDRLNALGGTFKIDSSPGIGARFTILLPLNSRDAPTQAREDPQALAAGESDGGPGQNDQPVRLLVVDDHTIMREALVAMLQDHREFAIVGEAANGAEAVELASQLRPDVVIMDVNMPDMDGIEATRRIKQQFPEIQIVALSMLEEDSGSRLMLNAGASAYLLKDGPSGELFARIRNLRRG